MTREPRYELTKVGILNRKDDLGMVGVVCPAVVANGGPTASFLWRKTLILILATSSCGGADLAGQLEEIEGRGDSTGRCREVGMARKRVGWS